jgi:hypothetical protein
MIAKFQGLEWIPSYNPREEDQGQDPPSRTIIEDPVVFLHTFGSVLGFVRAPFASSAAIQEMNATYHPDVGDDLRRRINRWRSWQKMYRDCGWGGVRFDGDAFERKRSEFVRVLDELETLEQDAQHPKRSRDAQYPLDSQQPLVGEEKEMWEGAVERLDLFLVLAAGENAI